MPSAGEMQSLNLWATREVQLTFYKTVERNHYIFISFFTLHEVIKMQLYLSW